MSSLINAHRRKGRKRNGEGGDVDVESKKEIIERERERAKKEIRYNNRLAVGIRNDDDDARSQIMARIQSDLLSCAAFFLFFF